MSLSKGIEEMLKKVTTDVEFKAALNNCQSSDEVIKLVENFGITVTQQELTEFLETQKSDELSDAALDQVSGAGCNAYIGDICKDFCVDSPW